MNERIKTLFIQAGGGVEEENGNLWTYCEDLDPEKFAELIVRECAEMVRKNNYQFMSNEQHYGVTSGDILKHFGVEERKGWVCPKCGIDRTKDVCSKGHTAVITGDCPMIATAYGVTE